MPAEVIRIEGLRELLARVNKAESNYKPTMTKGMNAAITHVHDQIPGYPPTPPGSTYVRTMELGRKMHSDVEEIGGDIAGVIGNPVIYAPLVISTEEVGGIGPQAGMHQGRWWTLQEEVDKAMPEVFKILADALLKLVS